MMDEVQKRVGCSYCISESNQLSNLEQPAIQLGGWLQAKNHSSIFLVRDIHEIHIDLKT